MHIAHPNDSRHSLAKRFIDLKAFGQLNWGNPLRKCTRTIDIVQRGIAMYHCERNTAERIRVLTDDGRAQASASIDPYSAEPVDLLREARLVQGTPPPIPGALELI